MVTIEEMKRWKRILGMTSKEISASSGVPLSTVQKIFSGVTRFPREATLAAILSVLEQKAQAEGLPFKSAGTSRASSDKADSNGRTGHAYTYDESLYMENFQQGLPDRVEETAGLYHVEKKDPPKEKKQGEYTLEDYYALPDERRVELIDGVIYDMSVPAIIHQKILGELFILFRECMDRHEGKCEVYLSPCDVRLDRDNRTMVQPDLLVVCEEYDVRAKNIEGAPDLTLEILSPSTRSKDMLLKLYKYANAGVREYWIVDPEQKTVFVYDLEHENYYPDKYSFEDSIPIRISGGECSIDFSRILRRIERYYLD